MTQTNEAAFETVIEAHLLTHGYVPVDRGDFDRERAIFPQTALTFIRETQPKEWAKLAEQSSVRANRDRQCGRR
jgi:type I restriction enzyme R subunit